MTTGQRTRPRRGVRDRWKNQIRRSHLLMLFRTWCKMFFFFPFLVLSRSHTETCEISLWLKRLNKHIVTEKTLTWLLFFYSAICYPCTCRIVCHLRFSSNMSGFMWDLALVTSSKQERSLLALEFTHQAHWDGGNMKFSQRCDLIHACTCQLKGFFFKYFNAFFPFKYRQWRGDNHVQRRRAHWIVTQ